MAEDVSRRGTLLEQALEKGKPKRAECGVPRMLRSHPDRADEITELLAAAPGRVPYTVAATILKDEGINVSPGTLSRHSRSVCSCRF